MFYTQLDVCMLYSNRVDGHTVQLNASGTTEDWESVSAWDLVITQTTAVSAPPPPPGPFH